MLGPACSWLPTEPGAYCPLPWPHPPCSSGLPQLSHLGICARSQPELQTAAAVTPGHLHQEPARAPDHHSCHTWASAPGASQSSRPLQVSHLGTCARTQPELRTTTVVTPGHPAPGASQSPLRPNPQHCRLCLCQAPFTALTYFTLKLGKYFPFSAAF